MKNKKIIIIIISVILIIIGLVLAIVLVSKNDSKDKDQTKSNNQSVEKDNIINYEDAYGTYNNAEGLKLTKKNNNFEISNLSLYNNDEGDIEIKFDLKNSNNKDYTDIYMVLYLKKDSEKSYLELPISSIKAGETIKMSEVSFDNIYCMSVTDYDFEIVFEPLVGGDYY